MLIFLLACAAESSLSRPNAVALAGDLIYVSDFHHQRIVTFDDSGRFLSSMGHQGLSGDGLWEVWGMLADDRDLHVLNLRPTSRAWLLSGERADINHLNWMMIHQRGGQFCFGSAVCEEHNRRFEGPLRNRWQMRIERILPTLTEERFGDWRIGAGQGHEALLELIAESRERGYDLLLVNMPVHQVYRDEIPPEDYAAYLDYITALSEEHGVPIFDANTPQWNHARDRFYDPDHLSSSGALLLSRALCARIAPMLRKESSATPSWK